MPVLRAVTLAAVLAFLLSGLALAQAPVDWYTDTGGGGVLAQPPGESQSGGALSPATATGPVDGADSDISATPPIASTAQQAEPVLGAPADEPAPAPRERPEPRAAQDAPTVTGGQEQEAEEAGPIASLPLTGLQLGALAGAGLCLLIAGAALRPRRTA